MSSPAPTEPTNPDEKPINGTGSGVMHQGGEKKDPDDPDSYALSSEQDGGPQLSEDDLRALMDDLHDLRGDRKEINDQITAKLSKVEASGLVKDVYKFVEKVADYDQTKIQAVRLSLRVIWKALVPDDNQQDLFDESEQDEESGE